MDADDVLTTTRAVRRRLDLSRPVSADLVDDCIRIAQQAPSGSNRQSLHFVVVTDPVVRGALADVYRRVAEMRRAAGRTMATRVYADESQERSAPRIMAATDHLIQHLHEVPVLVLACVEGTDDAMRPADRSAFYGSAYPGVWSFMLAARARGLGTCLTTIHIALADEVSELLGLPDDVSQLAMIPLAHTIGTDFRPAERRPLDQIRHREHW